MPIVMVVMLDGQLPQAPCREGHLRIPCTMSANSTGPDVKGCERAGSSVDQRVADKQRHQLPLQQEPVCHGGRCGDSQCAGQ